MDIKVEVRYIRRKLEDFEYFEHKLRNVEEMLEAVHYELSSVKGVSFDKEASGEKYSSGAKPDRFYELMQKEAELVEQAKVCKRNMAEIEQIISRSKDRELLEEIYINHKPIRQYADENHYAVSTVYDKIWNAILNLEKSVKFGE